MRDLARTGCKRDAAGSARPRPAAPVNTDLFVATSGVDAAAFAGAVPPACRREPSPPAVVAVTTRELVLELPEWRPRIAARHLLPSISVLTDAPYAARFELSVSVDGHWSPWIGTVTLGTETFAPAPSRGDLLECDVDVFTAAAPCEAARLRIRLGAADPGALAAAPWAATLSASDLAPPTRIDPTGTTPRLAVPALSQMEAPPEIALRICSPTSVAMVLAYWAAPAAVTPLADEMFHPATDRYGIWPAAIKAAGRRGVAGYLLRFPDWPSAAWCLARGLPIIASVRYAAGELTGAPLRETSGHLLVLAGCDGDHVLVNDPVAPSRGEVPRRYLRAELQRAWLDRAGVGYVLFRPEQVASADRAGAVDVRGEAGSSTAAPGRARRR
jgi:hypothetical protein